MGFLETSGQTKLFTMTNALVFLLLIGLSTKANKIENSVILQNSSTLTPRNTNATTNVNGAEEVEIAAIDLYNCGAAGATYDDAAKNVKFFLHKNGEENGCELILQNNTCLETNFVVSAPVVIVCHGWRSSPKERIGTTIREAFQTISEPTNLIYVNWEQIANTFLWEYSKAANSVAAVGNYTKEFLNFLINSKMTTAANITYVGHSLGSHVGHFAGGQLSNGTLGKLIALDPARPCFNTLNKSQRLNQSDADYVVVIHSNMKKDSNKWLGLADRLGHADFYPNGGESQPGCYSYSPCNHERAILFFAESVKNSTSFFSCKCDDWKHYKDGCKSCTEGEYMGWGTTTKANGTFFLKTRRASPFSTAQSLTPFSFLCLILVVISISEGLR